MVSYPIAMFVVEVVIGINRSFNMEPATAIDVCDGMFKSKIITVYGNAFIIKQTGPKLVHSVEQRKALELMRNKMGSRRVKR